jgi:hypothetical protein
MLTVKFVPEPWRRYMLECAALDTAITVSSRECHYRELMRAEDYPRSALHVIRKNRTLRRMIGEPAHPRSAHANEARTLALKAH